MKKCIAILLALLLISGSIITVECSSKKYPLENKVIVQFGDSITGNYNYPEIIKKMTFAKVYNVGFGGCRMSVNSDSKEGIKYVDFSMARLADELVKSRNDKTRFKNQYKYANELRFRKNLDTLKKLDLNKVDIVTIFYGANDYGGDVPLENPDDPYDVKTFGGALRYSLESITSKYPDLQVILVTPTWRSRIKLGDGKDADNYCNNIDLYVKDYVDKVIEIGDEYGVSVYNAYDELGINKKTAKTYLSDGLHPTKRGLSLIAEKLTKFITAEYTD